MTNDGSSGFFSTLVTVFTESIPQWAVTQLDKFLGPLIEWIIKDLILDTPFPSPASGGIFGAPPTDSSFYNLYTVYHDAILPISTLLVMLGLAVLLFTGIWSSKKQRVTAIRRLMFAIPAILIWWYVAGWYLQFIQAFTGLIMDIGASQSATDNMLINNPNDIIGGVIIAALLYLAGLGTSTAVLGVFLIRWVAIHLYMAGMPLLIAIWCVPVYGFDEWAKQFMQKFVPLSLIPIPVAFLLSMFAVIDFSSVEFAGVPGAGEIFDMIIGLVILAIAAYLPVSMLSMNLSSAASKADTLTRYAAEGFRSGSTPGGDDDPPDPDSGGAGTQSNFSDFGGSSTGGQQADHQTTGGSATAKSFEHPTASQSKRQRRRAAKVGATSRKTGAWLHGMAAKTLSKGKSATETAAGHTYKNYTKSGSTAKGLAGDARRGAQRRGDRLRSKTATAAKSPAQGMSKRMQKARDNMARRSQEFTEKWGHDTATQWPNESTPIDTAELPELPPAETELGEMAGGSAGSLWEDESGDGGLWSELDGGDEATPGGDENSAGMFIDEYSSTDQISRDATYDRNSTDREVGSFGGD